MKEKLRSIPLRKIEINDKSWNKYIDLVKEVIIPYQWSILNDLIEDAESSHCIHNFKVAAGEEGGEFQGVVFQDTDVAKWLEAVAYSLECHPDEELERLADSTIDLIGRAQQKDGYLDTYFIINEPGSRWQNLMEGHELYTAGHMIEAAVAYYEATGKDRFLNIVSRLADLICKVFGPGEEQCHGYPGHQEIELALVKLYRVTGKKNYLDLAKYFIDRRGVGENYFLSEVKRRNHQYIFQEFRDYDPKYSQSHIPVRQQKTAEGHAVRAVYMYSAMADLAYEYEDQELLEVCKGLWQNIVSKRMYLTGGIGSSGLLERFTADYDLPNDCNYSETCASIGLALFGKRMAEITRDGSYMDSVERSLYNTLLSGIALDGKSFFYVNPLEVWPDNCIPRTSKEHVKPRRQKWFGVACCPPNIARTLASFGQYIYFQDDYTLYVNLYVSSQVETELCKEEFSFRMRTELPQSGKCTVEIRSRGKEEKTVAFRVPFWVQDFKIQDSEGQCLSAEVRKGYAYISGRFEDTVLTVTFGQKAAFVRANPKVRADAGKIAIVKGPVVYCLEEADNGDNLASVYVDGNQELTEVFEPELLGGTLTVHLKGKKISTEGWNESQLYGDREVQFIDLDLKAIPYSSWANRKPGEMTVWMKELIQ